MSRLGTFWRTVRHLKVRQVAGRARFRLHRPTPDLRAAPTRRMPSGRWVTPARREPTLSAGFRLKFLGIERALEDCGWDHPTIDKLWRYNQHYFDDLNARDAVSRAGLHRDFLAQWLQSNPPGAGVGWEPYPVSLRLVNWIKWWLGGAPPEADWLQSGAVQARWLRRRLEVHLLGNHLFANAKALVFAGAFFQGREAESWLQKGLSILERELVEQVLADGAQFERSPMYHALAFEDVLDLLNLAATFPTASSLGALETSLRRAAGKMLFWLRCMTHPDGTLGLFNDCAAGVAPETRDLERYAAAVGVTALQPPARGITSLEPSGYIRVVRGPITALLDTAPVGPDYLPGHAHADTLSFEMSIGTQRVIVNGGTSCYGCSERRRYERSTAAHSTVEVDDESSSEVWGSFRVGRRARPFGLTLEDWHVCCSHDGYRFLRGKPVHRRCWQFGSGSLRVEDSVLPRGRSAVARYFLAPGVTLKLWRPDVWHVCSAGKLLGSVEVQRGKAIADEVLHAPSFGALVPAVCLTVKLMDGSAATRWTWADNAHSVSDG